MLVVIFLPLVEQLVNPFADQRTLYETRERPSKTYSWVAFMCSMTASELPWQIVVSLTTFFTFYYPVGLYRNATHTDSVHERGALFFLIILIYFIYTLTYSHMVVAAIPQPETAGNVSTVLFNIMLAMSGVLAPYHSLNRLWKAIYRVSPFTYLISGLLSTGIADSPVICSELEILTFPTTPNNVTCQDFLGSYAYYSGGNVLNPTDSNNCRFCSLANTNTYLASINAPLNEAWRNFGLLIVYTFFNFGVALILYWAFRVPKKWNKKKAQ